MEILRVYMNDKNYIRQHYNLDAHNFHLFVKAPHKRNEKTEIKNVNKRKILWKIRSSILLFMTMILLFGTASKFEGVSYMYTCIVFSYFSDKYLKYLLIWWRWNNFNIFCVEFKSSHNYWMFGVVGVEAHHFSKLLLFFFC